MLDGVLHLLLARADDGTPELPDGLPFSSLVAARPEALPRLDSDERDDFRDVPGAPAADKNQGEAPDDVPSDLWGVIVPEGPAGERLLALIDRLYQARWKSQGVKPPVYPVPAAAQMSINDAVAWRRNVYDDTSHGLDRARYLLILGDLSQVPFAIQQVQSTDAYVGRLFFADESGYGAYVDKVLRAEASPSGCPGRIVFHSAHDGSSALEIGTATLIEPAIALLKAEIEQGRCLASGVVAYTVRDKPGKDVFLANSAVDEPGVLLSMSHGLGVPQGGWPSPDAQRAQQGSMAFGAGDPLPNEALATRPFMPNGLWMMFSCFSAGTPSESAYQRWLDALGTIGSVRNVPDVRRSLASGPPFIADLPQKVLANPQGPLAFIGHVDLAWTYSYRDADQKGRPGPFVRVINNVIGQSRVGLAFRELSSALIEADAQIGGDYADDTSASPPSTDELNQRYWRWMTRQDLAGFILLGDPFVRLPVSLPVPLESTAEAPPPTPLERAVGEVLAGAKDLAAVAAEHQIDQGELEKTVNSYRRGGRRASGMG